MMRKERKEKDYKKLSRIKSVIFLVLAVLVLAGMYVTEQPGKSSVTETASGNQVLSLPKETEPLLSVSEAECYTDKEHVALYLHEYGHLPENYITKKEAKKEGWKQEEGNLGEVCPGKSIGGDLFRNEEGHLPEKDGRTYYECDIGYEGGERGEKRIVYSGDGLIYYTEDHYNTFELLYGVESL